MPEVLNPIKSDHSFGMVMPGRSWTAASAEGYRFGFNGKESDGEIKGDGNSLDFGARVYDSRLGRWLSPDYLTKKSTWLSPYVFAGNHPITSIDLNGYGEDEVATNPAVKTNILIIIPATSEEVNSTMPGPHGDWYVIVANDLVDAYKQFHEYTGAKRVDNIVLDTHGAIEPGYLMISGSNSPEGQRLIDNTNIKEYREERAGQIKEGKPSDEASGGDDQIAALSMLSLGINDGGNFVINSCRSGGDLTGKKLINEMGIITNYRVNIYLSQGVNNGTIWDQDTNRDGIYAQAEKILIFGDLFDSGKSSVCSSTSCYSNKDHPADGFLMMPAHSSSGMGVNLSSDGIHNGNIELHETGSSPVEVEKKSSGQ